MSEPVGWWLGGPVPRRVERETEAEVMISMSDSSSNIQVEITDESVEHCLKIVFNARPGALDEQRQPLEIFLHTTQAIDLVHKLSLAICERHRRDSALLLKAAARGI